MMQLKFFYFRDFLPTLTLCLGLGVLFIGIFQGYQKYQFWHGGLRAMGKVIKIQRSKGGLRTYLSPVVIEYNNAHGMRIETSLSDLQIDNWGVGDSIPIRYSKKDSRQISVDDGWSRWFITIFILVSGLIFIAISVCALFLNSMQVGAGLFGALAALSIFGAYGAFYRSFTYDKRIISVEAKAEEYFYHRFTRMNSDGTHGLPGENYFVRLRFNDQAGHSQKVVVECGETLTTKPLGALVTLQYDPRSIASAELKAPANAGYVQSVILFIFGLFVSGFAYLLWTRGVSSGS